MSRVVASAIEAAFETDDDEPRRSRHRGVKVLAAGAAAVAAARVASSQSPKLSRLDALTTLGKVTRIPDMFRNVPDRVRDRLADGGWIDEKSELGPEDVAAEDEEVDEDEEFDEDLEGDEDYGEPEEEEPEGEADEGPDDEGDDWPDDEDDDGGGGDAIEVDRDEEEGPGVAESGEGSALEQAAQGLDLDTNGQRALARGAVPDVMGLLSAHREPPPLLSSAKRTRRIDPVARPPEPPTTESGSKKAKAGSR